MADEDGSETWYSLCARTVELCGRADGQDAALCGAGRPPQPAVPLPTRMSARNVARFDAAGSLLLGSSEMVSVSRAASDIAAIDEFYRDVAQATTTLSYDTPVKRRYAWSGALSDVCFVEHPAGHQGAALSVAGLESMLWAVHVAIMGAPPADGDPDKYTDNHYVRRAAAARAASPSPPPPAARLHMPGGSPVLPFLPTSAATTARPCAGSMQLLASCLFRQPTARVQLPTPPYMPCANASPPPPPRGTLETRLLSPCAAFDTESSDGEYIAQYWQAHDPARSAMRRAACVCKHPTSSTRRAGLFSWTCIRHPEPLAPQASAASLPRMRLAPYFGAWPSALGIENMNSVMRLVEDCSLPYRV